MLIEKLNCPYGCQNASLSESTKRVPISGSNLLLETNSPSTAVEIVKVYTCNCCHRSFESHSPKIGDRIVL